MPGKGPPGGHAAGRPHDCDPNKIPSMAVDECSDVGTRISGEGPNLLG